MTRRKKLKTQNDDVELRYQNRIAQLVSMMLPWCTAMIWGRAAAKTTQYLAERVQSAVKECPGAPFVWISDTYSDLHKNIIPSLMEGLQFLNWHEGSEYVINVAPPDEWKMKMYNVCASYKEVMTFYNGFTFTFISLDRMSIGAGRSYVGLFGDEIKYWSEEKFTNVVKAVRGYRAKYGDNPWYRSWTLCSDMYNPNHIGEYGWMLKLAKLMDKDRVMLLLKVSFIYNETKITYASYLQDLNEAKKNNASEDIINELNIKLEKAEVSMNRWKLRWLKARKRVVLFVICSSFINADILGEEYFTDEFNESLEGFETNILSIIPKLSDTARFYPTLSINNFYSDGFLNDVISSHKLGWQETCDVLKYLNKNMALDGGMDAGNMLSMVFGQQTGHTYRVLKEIYTLPPNNERQLANEFIRFFEPHKRKVLKLYYDRSMNSYHKVRADMARKIKNCIEFDEAGLRTGWTVQLMSLGQGDIYSDVEYRFMSALFGGLLNAKLFEVLIDQYNCPNLKAEMENTPTLITKDKFNHDVIRKAKNGDKVPVDRLAKESTNLTDAFKYLMMRKSWMNVWGNFGKVSSSLDPK